jgi:hypothetical protein
MNFDRLKEAFAKLVREIMSKVDYYALYPSKVVKQDANGNLELQPEDSRIAAPTGVPIRLGIPGAKVEVQPGGRVLLGFENGDPRFPVALLWGAATVQKFELNANEIILNGGTHKVARDGDAVTLGVLTGLVPLPSPASPTPVEFILLPPGTLPLPPGATVLDGIITEGADGVKA